MNDTKQLIKTWPLDLSILFRLDCDPIQNLMYATEVNELNIY